MIDQPASGDRHRSKGTANNVHERPICIRGTTQVQQEAPADLVDTNDEARARVALTTPSTLRSRHSTTRGATTCECHHPFLGTATSTGTQAGAMPAPSDETASAWPEADQPATNGR